MINTELNITDCLGGRKGCGQTEIAARGQRVSYLSGCLRALALTFFNNYTHNISVCANTNF